VRCCNVEYCGELRVQSRLVCYGISSLLARVTLEGGCLLSRWLVGLQGGTRRFAHLRKRPFAQTDGDIMIDWAID
jgi:hypothetical protein